MWLLGDSKLAEDLSTPHLIPLSSLSTNTPPNSTHNSTSKFPLSTGAIAGISAGAVILLCLCGGCLALLFWINRSKKKEGTAVAGKVNIYVKQEEPVLVLKKRSSYQGAAAALSSTRGGVPLSSAYSAASSGRASSALSKKGSSRFSRKSSLGRKRSSRASRKKSLGRRRSSKGSRKKSFKGTPAPAVVLLVPTGKGSWTAKNLKT